MKYNIIPIQSVGRDRFCLILRRVIDSCRHYSQEFKDDQASCGAGWYEDAVGFIATSGGEDVGVAFGHSEGDGVFWLSWVGVIPEYRGRGIASALLIALEGATIKTHHKIWTSTLPENTEVARLLTAEGWRICAVIENHWYGLDNYFWQKLFTVNVR